MPSDQAIWSLVAHQIGAATLAGLLFGIAVGLLVTLMVGSWWGGGVARGVAGPPTIAGVGGRGVGVGERRRQYDDQEINGQHGGRT